MRKQGLARFGSWFTGWEALRHPAYRTYTLGSVISWVGDWLDLTTLNWAALQMTGSSIDLGIINACRMLPVFVLSFPAGVLADRFDRRKLVFILQATVMVLTFVIGAVVQMNAAFWVFALIVFLRSVANAMVIPVRNSLASNFVPKEVIASGTAIQTTIMNLARIIGPALAGWLLTFYSAPVLFYINGTSFIFVLYTLTVLRGQSNQTFPRRMDKKSGMFSEVFSYLRENPSLKALLALSVFPMIFGFPYTTMMPLFVRDLFLGGPEKLGFLLSMAALGALGGSVLATRFSKFTHAGRWMLGVIVFFGGGLLALSWVPQTHAVAALMVLVGASSQIYRTLNRMAFQVTVPDHLRGRILSIALMDRGFIPIGSLIVGFVAELWSTQASLAFMGIGCILISVLVGVFSPAIRDLKF